MNTSKLPSLADYDPGQRPPSPARPFSGSSPHPSLCMKSTFCAAAAPVLTASLAPAERGARAATFKK